MDTKTLTDLLGHLQPAWPTAPNGNIHLLALTLTGLTKLRRGENMHRRARTIDLFGWSIILFDLVFGGALVISSLWTIYPRLKFTGADMMLTLAILAVAILQNYTMERASDHRVNRAMEPPPVYLEDGTPMEHDRRKNIRREADRRAARQAESDREELARLRAQCPER